MRLLSTSLSFLSLRARPPVNQRLVFMGGSFLNILPWTSLKTLVTGLVIIYMWISICPEQVKEKTQNSSADLQSNFRSLAVKEEGRGTLPFMSWTTKQGSSSAVGDNDKNHEIDKMVFRKKKRNVACVLTLSAVSAVTCIILVQNRSLQEEGESLDLLASSPRQEHDVKGKTSIRYYA